MSNNQKATTPAKYCLKCQEMYGHPTYNDMCSLCFKKQKQQVKREEQALLDEATLKQLPKEILSRVDTHIGFSKALKQPIKIENFQKQKQTSGKKEQEKKQKVLKKCMTCGKKTGILGYACKHCSNEFCKFHRLPEDHKCEVDFIEAGRKKLKLDNPVIGKEKIQRI